MKKIEAQLKLKNHPFGLILSKYLCLVFTKNVTIFIAAWHQRFGLKFLLQSLFNQRNTLTDRKSVV